MLSPLEDIEKHLLAQMKENEIVIDFKPTTIGLEYHGNIVVGVYSQAARAGIKLNWIISAVNNNAVPNNTALIDEAIQETFSQNEPTLITFLRMPDSNSHATFEVEDGGIDREFRKYHRSRVIFIEAYSKMKHYPIFTYGIIFICIILFFVEIANNNWVFESLYKNPLLGPSDETLRKMGAKDTTLIVEYNQWYRLFFPIFLHNGLIYLAFNMLTLYKLGGYMEGIFGFTGTMIIFFVSGTFSMIISAIFVPWKLTSGSSGAVFGILGSSWADLIQNYSTIKNKCKNFVSIFLLTIAYLAFGFLPGIDNFCQIGGFICGVTMGLVVYIKRRYVNEQRQNYRKYQICNRIFGISVIVVMYFGALFSLYAGVHASDWCKWCHYLSCIQTKLWTCGG